MREGLVTKSLGRTFRVVVDGREVDCSARGRLRRGGSRPIAGDRVAVTLPEAGDPVIEEILPRRNELDRPPVANVDRVVVVLSVREPDPNPYLADRVLVAVGLRRLSALVCVNKIDLVERPVAEEVGARFACAGYPVIYTSALSTEGVNPLRKHLARGVYVFAGESGVGKSSLLNALKPDLRLRTAGVSRKAGRGRHTTRHVELLPVARDSWVADTPGFCRFDLDDVAPEELASLFPEIALHAGRCRYSDCLHRGEDGCAVEDAVSEGAVRQDRFESYLRLLDELEAKEAHRY